jgi:hypothetical protein
MKLLLLHKLTKIHLYDHKKLEIRKKLLKRYCQHLNIVLKEMRKTEANAISVRYYFEFLFGSLQKSILGEMLVITAWRKLILQMEEMPSRYGG